MFPRAYALKGEKQKLLSQVWTEGVKEGGRWEAGGCRRWKPKNAIKIKAARWIMRLQGWGTMEGPDQIYCFPGLAPPRQGRLP